MRAVPIILVVVGVAAILVGAYICTTGGRFGKSPSTSEPAQTVSPEAIEDLRVWTEDRFERFESRIEDLEVIIGKIYKEISSLKGSPDVKPPKPPENQPPPRQEGSSTSPLREEVRLAMQERDKERRERMFDEMLQRFTQFTQRRIERLADRRAWDEQKKQAVIEIASQHHEGVTNLIEAARQEGSSDSGIRESIAEKIRVLGSATVDRLRMILTPDEAEEVQRILEPPRREREPFPETPESAPLEPEPEE